MSSNSFFSSVLTSRSFVAMAGVSDDATSIMDPEVRRRNDRAAITVVTPILGGPSVTRRPCPVCLSLP